ncbi:MAG: hypothetical protein NDF54_04435 [archaeon GB-1867-035]|nr:hypothetical protein [Candidatus Culexmicrobium profundum]
MEDELSRILLNRDLAKLGDSLVNFIYSAAKSRILGRFYGERVSNKVLSEALCRAGLRGKLPLRSDVHVRGNAAEALIAYAWVNGFLSVDEAIVFLSSNLRISENTGRSGEFEAAVNAFTGLLKHIWRFFIES